jgi:hypothetical protein
MHVDQDSVNSRAVVNKLLNFYLYVHIMSFYCFMIFYLYQQMHIYIYNVYIIYIKLYSKRNFFYMFRCFCAIFREL